MKTNWPWNWRLNIPKSTLTIHWKDWCWSSSTLATWYEESTHWKIPWCWEQFKAEGEGGNWEWGGWMASLTQWTWVWASSRRWWRTGKPGMLQSMGSQRVGQNWATELNAQRQMESKHWYWGGKWYSLLCANDKMSLNYKSGMKSSTVWQILDHPMLSRSL